MKILTIYPITGNTEIVERLLEKGVYNDYLFERCGFYMEIQPTKGVDGWLDFLYRKLWETIYLRKDNANIETYYKNSNGGKIMLFISLNEAIGFIKLITPPILRPRIPAALKSVDSIHSILKEYLLDSTPNQPPYVKTEFQKYMGFNKFETASEYRMERMSLMRKFVTDGIAVDIESHNAPSEKYIFSNTGSKDKFEIQLMLHAKTEYDLNKICYELGKGLGAFKVINVFTQDNGGYFVELYIPEYSYSRYESLGELIKRSYSKLMGK